MNNNNGDYEYGILIKAKNFQDLRIIFFLAIGFTLIMRVFLKFLSFPYVKNAKYPLKCFDLYVCSRFYVDHFVPMVIKLDNS